MSLAEAPRRRPTPARPRRAWWRRLLRLGATGVVALLAPLTVAAFGYDLVGGGVLAPAPLGANGHVLTAGGLTTRYEQWGSTGTPVVLVHGFLESAWVWHEVGPLLASRGYRVYAIDVRGYGYTSRTGPYTLAGDTAQLQTFLAALHLDAAHHAAPVLVGHSSGAAIVGNLARTDPAAVAAVAFMDGDGTPYGVGPGWVHRLFVDPYATALIRLVTHHPSLAGRAYRGACSASCPPFDASAWVRPMRVAGAESALKAILRQPLIGMTYAQERSMHVKAAVIYGTDDPEMTAGDAEATASRLHTHLVVPLPGAPHLGMLSSPTATAEAIARVAAP